MTGPEYRALRERLALSHAAMGRLLGMAGRNSCEWQRYGVANSPAAILLTLLARCNVTLEQIESARQVKGT